MSSCCGPTTPDTLLALLLVLAQVCEVGGGRVVLVREGALSGHMVILLAEVPVLTGTGFDVAGHGSDPGFVHLLGYGALVLGLIRGYVVERDLGGLLGVTS